jgi:(1->4)-alpha-D-glucan 1-alpha-D-glucosylmutase
MRPNVRATYRVQLTPTWGLERAAGIVGYLHRLGVSHLYTSPLAEATAGSTHGYDVVDHQRVRAELGGPEALRRLWEALDAHGMGMVVDLVPNHMGIRDPANRWWRDVLRDGPDSAYAGHFDIDWSPPDPASHGKVVLPFLGAPVEQAVADGSIRVERRSDGPELEVVHHSDRWPASEASLDVLGLAPTDCDDRVDGAVAELNRSPAALLRFLEAQHWRAVHWRDADTLLNWRRFFDVTDLASVRVERPEVFDDVHRLLRGWLDDELGARVVQGVRVDHVDGLVDPQGYLERLRSLVGPDRLLLVEKILAAHEQMPRTWPVDGTTGYEVVARLDEAVTEPEGAVELARLTHLATGQRHSWPELVRDCRHLVADRLLRPEVDRLVRAVGAALADDDGTAPPTADLRAVVVALAGEMAVYRTYARPGANEVAPDDRVELDRAAAELRLRGTVAEDVLDDVLALLSRERGTGPLADEATSRFGQVTAPLAAKAVEDTAFYREVSLPWLAEVGGDPGRPVVPLPHVGRALAGLQERWPGTLSPLTTHDTKRSGDVRARLSCLAVDPATAEAGFAAWGEAAAAHRGIGPDPVLERLLWASILGAWPVDAGRIGRFATKAMREAKLHTTWTDPDEAFERAVQDWVAAVLGDPALTSSIAAGARRLLAPGRAAALVLVTLAATAVGSPDLYQGDEVWNLSLVDPDNRRPVDHDHLGRLLDAVDGGVDLPALWRERSADPDDDGMVKLALWHRLLRLRAGHPAAFAGPHLPLALDEAASEAVLAYRRGDDVAVVAWARPGPAPHAPPGTVELPSGEWHDVVSGTRHAGGTVPTAALLTGLPVAALERA